MAEVLGVDLGGTKIDIGVVDEAGKILRRELIQTSKKGPESVVEEIAAAVKRLKGKVAAAGVGIAGQVEKGTGLVHFAPNLGWRNLNFGQKLKDALDVPVKITNDVRAAALGEWLHGAGQGCEDLLCLFVGTGIGGGIVSGGRMLEGSKNAAGEVGHTTIDWNGPSCNCGNRGCFEAFAGGWAIARRAKEVLAYDSAGGKGLLELVHGDADEIAARHVFEANRAKVPAAMKIYEEIKEALIAGVASLVNILNPEKIVLGGGIINGNTELIDVIREGVPRRALKVSVDSLQIVASQLKGDAGIIGAAALAREGNHES